MNKGHKKIFCLEGNIGAGKSTLLQILEKKIPRCKVIQEPVAEWKNIGGYDLLSAFYYDPSRWCFTFELYSMFTLVKKIQEAMLDDVDIILTERSIFSNRAFQFISYCLDKLDTKEMTILKEFFVFFMQEYPKLDGIIYLDTDVETCLQRITKRGREEEKGINYFYLKKLEEQFKGIKYNCTVKVINGNYDLKKTEQVTNEVLKFICNDN